MTACTGNCQQGRNCDCFSGTITPLAQIKTLAVILTAFAIPLGLCLLTQCNQWCQ